MNTSELKAKSRISLATPVPVIVREPIRATSESNHSFRKNRDSKNTFSFQKIFKRSQISLPNTFDSNQLGIKYLKALPWLGISFILYTALFYIFTTVHPAEISNFILYQSYLPVLLLFFFATFFLGKYIFLNHTKGLGLSTCFTLLLFLKLQSFELTPLLILSSFAVFVGVPLILPVLFKR